MEEKVYLGDSVYVRIQYAKDIVLTTENGRPDDPSNEIVLEPQVLSALFDYVNKKIREGQEDA